MDPMQTLIDADQHISDLQYVEALASLCAYYEWRVSGGFEPIPGSATIRGERTGDRVAAKLGTLLQDRLSQALDERGA